MQEFRSDNPKRITERSSEDSLGAVNSSDGEENRLKRMSALARSLPTTPGVYFLKDAEDRVIYVGKAVSLRNRVSTYFQPSADEGPRKEAMLGLIEGLDIIECEGEWEALMLEARLIKDLRPRFNARLTDGKTYPYLAVTIKDEFPAVHVTRSPSDEQFKGAKIFGPFSSAHALRAAIQLLQRVFKYRTCELDIRGDDPRNRSFRPCLLHSIGQCTAPCANRITKEDYRGDVQRFMRFLESKRSAMLQELREEMKDASTSKDFEKAAVLRDQIDAIERLDERERRRGDDRIDWQPEVTSFIHDPEKGLRSLERTLSLDQPIRGMEAIDIAHLSGKETVGSKVCFIDGRPFKDGYRRYRIRTVENDDYAAICEVIERRYSDAGEGTEVYPDVILIDGGLGQLNAAMEAFSKLDQKPPMVISLAKKEELIYVQGLSEPIRLGRENLGLKLCQAIRDEAHRFAQHYHHILRRKAVLGDVKGVSSRRRKSSRTSKKKT